MGLRCDGVDRLSYNHCDSYPEGLGDGMLRDLKLLLKRKGGAEALGQAVRRLRVVDERGFPGTEDQERYARFRDPGVGNGCDWYAYLRNLQGELKATLDAGIITDNPLRMADSVSIEWAYVVNCDERVFEVYRGWQREPHTRGRYASMPIEPRASEQQYYPLALIATFPFDDLPRSIAAALPREEDE